MMKKIILMMMKIILGSGEDGVGVTAVIRTVYLGTSGVAGHSLCTL